MYCENFDGALTEYVQLEARHCIEALERKSEREGLTPEEVNLYQVLNRFLSV